MQPAIDAMTVTAESEISMPDPFGTTLGPYESRSLGDFFGLTQFGAVLEILPPGSQSALRHWHTLGDEFVLMLEGELVLITDEGETAEGQAAELRLAQHQGNSSLEIR